MRYSLLFLNHQFVFSQDSETQLLWYATKPNTCLGLSVQFLPFRVAINQGLNDTFFSTAKVVPIGFGWNLGSICHILHFIFMLFVHSSICTYHILKSIYMYNLLDKPVKHLSDQHFWQTSQHVV